MQASWLAWVVAAAVLVSGCVGQPAPAADGVSPTSGEGPAGNETGNATTPAPITEETVIAEAPLSLTGPAASQELPFELTVDAPMLVIQVTISAAAALDLNLAGPGTCEGGGSTGQLTLVGPVQTQDVERACGPVPPGSYTASVSTTGGVASGTFRVLARPASGAGNATAYA